MLIRRLLVSDRIAEELRRRIAQGVYAPGTFIPPERQLAQAFGASRSTVSKALAALCEQGLIERTRGRGTRVLPLAERGTHGVIGIVHVAGPPYTAYSTLILQGMQQTLSRIGRRYELMPNPERGKAFTAESVLERYGGALFVEAPKYAPVILELQRRGFPYVVANLEVELDVTATWVDHAKTTRAAVRILSALGHRRILLVTQPRERLFYGQVVEGYLAGLRKAGLQADESLIIETGPDTLSAYTATREFLAGRLPPTAVVTGRDWLARGACEALAETGLEVGRDVSVIGFDDISWPEAEPFLTTFAEPMYEMGAVAAQMLVERLVSGERGVEKRELEAPLVLRRSAGPTPRDDTVGSPDRVLLNVKERAG